MNNLASVAAPAAAPAPLSPASLSFREVPCASPELPRLLALRYEVYCLEEGFLPAADYPDALESDEFDPFATHYGAFTDEGETVGAMRLVRRSRLGLPLEQHAGAALSPEGRAILGPGAAEISRLVIPRRHRQFGFGRPEGPAILFGLFGRLFHDSLRLGLSHWVAAMEPCLCRLLKRYGIRFTPIGEAVEYYGRVIPYAARIDDLARFAAESRPEVYSAVTREPALARC